MGMPKGIYGVCVHLIVFAVVGFWLILRFSVARVEVFSDQAHRLSMHRLLCMRKDASRRFFFEKGDAFCRVLAENAWVKSCSVQRMFPGTWNVRLSYHTPLLLHEKGFISTQGHVIPEPLGEVEASRYVRCYAPDKQAKKAASMYRMLRAGMPSSLHLRALHYRQGKGWWLVFSDGSEVVLGDKDTASRWAYFTKVYAKPSFSKKKKQYFDMRYSGAFAYRKLPKQ